MKVHSARALPLRDRIREVTSVAILDAAEAVVGEVGFAGSSLQVIAERAGTAVGTLYNYFSDKKALLAALKQRRHDELYVAIDAATRANARAPFEAQLHAFVHAVFTYFDAHRQFLRVSLEADPASPVVVKSADGKTQTVMHQLTDRAVILVRSGVKEKKVRADLADLAAVALVSIIRGVLIMKHDDDAPLDAETDAVVALFLHGAGKGSGK